VENVLGGIIGRASFVLTEATLRDAGDVVLVQMVLELTAHATGRTATVPIVEIYTVRDGLVTEIDVYPKDTVFLPRGLCPMTEYRPVNERRLRDRALHAFVSTKFGRRLFTGVLADLDRFLIARTRGRLQLAVGSPVCLLRARGARSGQLRVTPLLFTPRGDQIIIVASKGGAPSHPAWYHNVKANPDVEVDIQGKRRAMRAREVQGSGRRAMWTYVNDHFAGYDAYQNMVTRTIPVIVLEPRSG